MLIDAYYRVIVFNTAAEAMCRLPRQELLGRDLRELLDGWHIPHTHRYIIHALELGTVTTAQQQTYTYNDQTMDHVVDASPVYNSRQRIVGAVALFYDARYQQVAIHRIHHLETLAAIGQLAAGTVHEVRNPLTAIKGFTQLVSNRATELQETSLTNYCSIINREIEHLNQILSEFLALARPCSENFTTIDFVKVVEDVVSFLYGDAVTTDVSLVTNLPHAPIYIRGNADKLKEVVINLCRNAFQAMAAGGLLTLTIDETPDTVYLQIQDTGHGMTSDIIAQIFNPFFTTKESGTGLGLPLCRQKIRQHNGDISVTSEPGMGSTFTITLPRIKTDERN